MASLRHVFSKLTQFSQLLHYSNAFWQTRSYRERLAIIMIAMMVLPLLIYLIGIAPAWNVRKHALKELPELRAQVLEAMKLSAQAQRLGPIKENKIPPPANLSSLQDSLNQAGLSSVSISQGNEGADTQRLELLINEEATAPLMSWIDKALPRLGFKIIYAKLERPSSETISDKLKGSIGLAPAGT